MLKRRFRILIAPPEYRMGIQARIPPALCCVHNIIRKWDPVELGDMGRLDVDEPQDESGAEHEVGSIADSAPTNADRKRMCDMRDKIAEDMWKSYAAERARRGDPIPNFELTQ